MLATEPPSVSHVLRRNKLISRKEKTLEDEANKEFVIVTVFGSSNKFYHSNLTESKNEVHFKQPFRLILDAFGICNFNSSNTIYEKCLSTGKNETNTSEEPVPLINSSTTQTLDTTVVSSAIETENVTNIQSQSDNEYVTNYHSDDCSIDGFYNEEESVLFLHLEGAHDPHLVLHACENLQLTMNDPSFIPKWCNLKTKYCQSLLLLFSLSHIMILSSTDNYFDTSYIHLFRAIDAVRLMAKPYMSQLLRELDGLPRNWVDQGRLCSPRIIFFFEVDSVIPPRKLIKILSSTEVEEPMVSERQNLEEDIYQILRKCRITSNNNVNSLFTIQRSQEFVYLHEKAALETDCLDYQQMFNHTILQFCQVFNTSSVLNKESSTAAAPVAASAPAAAAAPPPAPAPAPPPVAAAAAAAAPPPPAAAAAAPPPAAAVVAVVPSAGTSTTTVTTPPILPLQSPSVFFSQKEALVDHSILSDFREFILGHIQAVRDNDDYKKSGEQLVRPTWKEWTNAYKTLFTYLVLGQHDEPKAIDVTNQLKRYCDIDSDYLENQCANMFSKIYGIYQKNIPEFYSEEEHRTRMKLAANAFLNISRSSGVFPWLDKLAVKCERYWKNGHQQCEARSLHEHPCINQLHRIPPGDHLEVIPFPDMDESLPELHHNAGNRLTSYCNCGKRTVTRDEPFTIREANHDFYKRIGKDCCERLDAWEFPVFVPATDGAKELSLKEMLDIIRSKKSIGPDGSTLNGIDLEILENENVSQVVEIELRQVNDLQDENESGEEEDEDDNRTESIKSNETDGDLPEPNNEEEKEETSVQVERSTELHTPLDLDIESNHVNIVDVEALSQDILPEEVPHIVGLIEENLTKELTPVETNEKENVEPKVEEKWNMHKSNIVVQSSRVEYLPGMIHSKSPKGLLPIFPSWALVCLGSSRIYSHNTGITHQSGFLPGSNFLLPWHVKVKSNDTDGTTKTIPRISRGRTNVKRARDEFYVKVFVGLEYECKRGHRFFVEDPGKILYHHNINETLHKKDAAIKVATADMPLYVKCPCNSRDGRDLIAQLLRLHVVTPKAPVNVTLNPRVQPGPHPCPVFTPGNQEVIKLTPSAYWILRLPYSYVGDDQVYVPPQDVTSYNGRIMRGLCEVVTMSPSETKEWKNQNPIT